MRRGADGAPILTVILREGGESSTPRLSASHKRLWNTGSPAFAGDDSCGRGSSARATPEPTTL
ncbi:hypothetical protein XH83_17755 [Bradyrhizobium sp. CCBAU 53351]|nr:hypothetical protein XH83_17755 [Bradyrhizobium sp. CCBAU 53351]